MTRKTFLTVVSLVALLVGVIAAFAPAALLAGKGVAPSPTTNVWVREVGVLILAVGIMAFLSRTHGDSPTLRAVCIGNAVLHLGLLPIEIVAYSHGIITAVSGVVPNSILHLTVAVGFTYFAATMKMPSPARA